MPQISVAFQGTALDDIGGATPVVTGSPTFSSTAVSFDNPLVTAAAQYVTYSFPSPQNNFTPSSLTGFSLSFWFALGASRTTNEVPVMLYSGSYMVYVYNVANGTASAVYGNVGGSTLTFGFVGGSSQPLVIGEWNHAVVVTNNTYIGVYFNGQLFATSAVSTSTYSITTLRAGCNAKGNYYAFTGGVKRVAVYNSVLGASEVAGVYALGLAPPPTPPPPSSPVPGVG